MRVATSASYTQGVNVMNDRQFKMNKTMLQLSTGKRIITPSDDPAGSTKVLGLNQALSRTEQFQKNIDTLKSHLELEESAISGITHILQRSRELTIQGATDTYDANQRGDIAMEIREHVRTLYGIANTADGSGDFLFGGFDNRNEPFANNAGVIEYRGDHGQQMIQVGATRQIASGDNGFDVFMNIRGTDNGDATNNQPMSMFAIVQELETVLSTNAGSPTANPAEDFSDSMLRIIGNLDAAISQVTDLQGEIGARINAAESQESVNEDYLVQVKTARSATEDLDYTEAISQLEQEQIGLQASQQTFSKIQGLSLFNFI